MFFEILSLRQPKEYTGILAASPFGSLNCRAQIPIKAKWQLALENITAVLAPAISNNATTIITPIKRLIWLVDPELNNTKFDVLEQKSIKKW